MTRPSACITIAACAALGQRISRQHLILTISARQVAGLVAVAIYASLCAHRLSCVNRGQNPDVLAPCAFKGVTMDRGILVIIASLAVFWLVIVAAVVRVVTH